MRIRWPLLVAVVCSTAWAEGPARGKRPAVDLSAMHEAMGSFDPGTAFPSAASYAHFLQARLSHHDGDHRKALDELRLALASDDSSPYLLTELGEQFARTSDLDRAELQLKLVVERFPDYAPAQLLFGRVLYEAQKPQLARAHLQKAIKLRPTDADAYLVLTQMWLDQGKVDEAVKVIEELGAAVPGEPIGFRRLGLALAERGDASRAEKLLVRAIDRDPGDLEAWATLARIYEATNRLPKALDALEKAVERDPENRDVLLTAGRVALRLGKDQDARAYFDQLLSLGKDPEWAVKVAFSYLALHQLEAAANVLDSVRQTALEPRLHFYAGLVHERLHTWQKAAEAFDRITKESGDLYNEARLHRAMSLSSLGQHHQALELFRRLGDEAGGLTGLDVAHARAFERAGQVREAENRLVKALNRQASNETLDAVTAFYQRQARLGDAIALFNLQLGKTPRDETVLFALALAHEKNGSWQKAVENMRRILELNPGNVAAANFVGYTLADHGQELEEATALVQRALDAKPDSAAFLDSMGWVLFKRGEADKAFDFLERAVDAAPDEVTLWEHLGDVAVKLGRKPRAHEAFAKSLELLTANPDSLDRPNQRADLERKLKLLSTAGQAR